MLVSHADERPLMASRRHCGALSEKPRKVTNFPRENGKMPLFFVFYKYEMRFFVFYYE